MKAMNRPTRHRGVVQADARAEGPATDYSPAAAAAGARAPRRTTPPAARTAGTRAIPRALQRLDAVGPLPGLTRSTDRTGCSGRTDLMGLLGLMCRMGRTGLVGRSSLVTLLQAGTRAAALAAALAAAGPATAANPAAATAAAHPGATATAIAIAPALSPAQLRQQAAAMPAGDAQRGQALYARQFCASCHGTTGATPSLNWPSVAGQRVAYSYKLLLDYQNGRHPDTHGAALMREAVWGLTPQEMADLAAYSARLPGSPAAQPRATAAPTTPAAGAVEHLVRHGDRTRLLTACASCHGARGEGSHQAQPALAGQNPAYLVRTLLAYHGNTRHNDPARSMRAFAAQLTRTEVDALAAYYAALPPPLR